MDGERSTYLYIRAVLGSIPEFNDKEEEEYYNKIKKEIEETRLKGIDNLVWVIPDD